VAAADLNDPLVNHGGLPQVGCGAALLVRRVATRGVTVPLDGMRTAFTTVAHRERFAAVARIDGRTVTLAGHGSAAELALRRLAPSGLRTPYEKMPE
jgi:hypothetical protein